MPPVRTQSTLAQTVVVEGTGYWSGDAVRVEFQPAEANSGVVFVREDLSPTVTIPATLECCEDIARRTSLRFDTGCVEMVEHVLAALAGMGVDNCQVYVNAPEMPACDGSAKTFVEAIDQAGISQLDEPVRRLVVDRPIRVGDDDCWIEACPSAGDDFLLEYQLDYGADNSIGEQIARYEITPEIFRREIAGSRTFLLEHEANWLLSQGLGKHVTTKDLLIFGDEGPIENTLRFTNECARHKLLDVVGDLCLSGCQIVGHITAHRSGHQLNAALAAKLLRQQETPQPQSRCA